MMVFYNQQKDYFNADKRSNTVLEWIDVFETAAKEVKKIVGRGGGGVVSSYSLSRLGSQTRNHLSP